MVSVLDQIHTGSWGTPDLGITEFVSDVFGGGRNQESGSNISGQSIISPVPKTETMTGLKGTGGTGTFSARPIDNTGQVLGTSTQQTPPSGGSGGGGAAADWAKFHGGEGAMPAGYGGEGGGGTPSVSASDISDAYAPALAALQGYIDAANTGATEDTTNLGTRVGNQKGQLDVQQGELLGDTATEQNKFNDSLRSALEDAIRAYNALAQQGNARFGRGNSAGGAVGELANQEFFRNQGANQKQQASGDLQFEGEKTKIKQFVMKGKQDLDMYHNEAITEIQKGLRQTLADIGSRKGDIETNKTRDRIAALQDAKATAQRVSEANTTYRQNLITTALSNMQSVAGRAFTPQEIAANMKEFESAIFGSSGNLQASAAPASSAIRNVNYKTPDELAQAGLVQDNNA